MALAEIPIWLSLDRVAQPRGPRSEVDEELVDVGAARDDHGPGPSRSATSTSAIVRAPSRVRSSCSRKRLRPRQLESHRLGRDHVRERAALFARVDGGVNPLGKLAATDDGTPRAPPRVL